MKRIILVLILTAVWLLPGHSALGEDWKIDDDHSNAYFSVKHMTIAKVRGTFAELTGTVTVDDGRITGINFTVGVDSINTGVVKRDDHLKSADFFEAASYPTMTFVSREIKPQGDGVALVTGLLTIKGNSKEVNVTLYGPTPEIKDPWGMTRRGLRIEAELNRKDFGINYNKVLDNGGLLIGNEVLAEADLEIIKP